MRWFAYSTQSLQLLRVNNTLLRMNHAPLDDANTVIALPSDEISSRAFEL